MNKTYKYTLSSGEKKEVTFDVGVHRLAISNANGEDGKSYTAGEGIAIDPDTNVISTTYTAGEGIAISENDVISSTLQGGSGIIIENGEIITNYTYPTSLKKIGSDNNGDYYQIKYHFSSVSSAQAIAQPLPLVPNIKICAVKWVSAKGSNLTFVQAYETDKVKADITNSVLNVTVLDSNTYDIDVLLEMFCTSPFFKITRSTDYPYHSGSDAGGDWHPTSYDASEVDYVTAQGWVASGECYCRMFAERDDIYGCFYPHNVSGWYNILLMTKGDPITVYTRAFQTNMYRGQLHSRSLSTAYADKGYYAVANFPYIRGVTITNTDKIFASQAKALQSFFD